MKLHKIVASCIFLTFGSNTLAAPITFTGSDAVGPGGASPNADSAYSDWLAALGSATTSLLDFESGDGGAILSGNYDPSVTGLHTGNNATLGYNTTAGGDTHFRFAPNFSPEAASVTWNMTPDINAWGGWFTGLETSWAGSVSVNYTSGASESLNVPENPGGGGVTFFGFVDLGASISSVTLTETGASSSGRDIWGIDDIETASVPEPETLFLLSLALLGLGIRSRKAQA